MGDECLQIVTIHGEKGPRNCRQPVKRDGYCARHHPDTVEERLQRMFNHDMIVRAREKLRYEEKIVGGVLREENIVVFHELLAKGMAEAESRILR